MAVRSLEIGLVLPMGDSFVDGETVRWTTIRDLAIRAEEVGFDTVWTADELLWRSEGRQPQGWWECVAMTGAVAAATSRIKVGTWILSALHRNPGITAKAVETLDEISGGRFVFGLGAGHAGRQGHAFGLPEDRTVGRFEEALEIILPLLRDGRANFEGKFHAARDLEHRPVGPRPGRIPIMIGAKGPRMLRLAARHADIWSWFVEERSDLTEFGPRLAALEAACADIGRWRGRGPWGADPRLGDADGRRISRIPGRRVRPHRSRALAADAAGPGRDGPRPRTPRVTFTNA